jgi:hypothetical protein
MVVRGGLLQAARRGYGTGLMAWGYRVVLDDFTGSGGDRVRQYRTMMMMMMMMMMRMMMMMMMFRS